MIAKQETTYYDVVGIGNAIVDVLAKVGEGFLKERNLPKGGMTLVDACLLYTSPSPRDISGSRMPASA